MKDFTSKLIPILEAVPSASTVVAGVYFSFRAQSGTLTTEQILGWILIVFSLMATSLFVDRLTKLSRIEKEAKEANSLIRAKEGTISISNVLLTRKQLEPLESRLENAREIFITGGSLFRLSSEYLGLFDKLLANECRIKLLLLDPNSYSARLVARNIVYEIADFEVYKSYINSSLSSFSKLREKYNDKVQIRVSEYLPAFSLLGINPSLDTGKIMVELYVHNIPTRERPHIDIFRRNDPFWFEFYNSQFNSLWNDSVDFTYESKDFQLFQ